MTSRQREEAYEAGIAAKEPKTPHEEIMFCIESTNDIVSKILEILERATCKDCKDCIYYKKQIMGVIG